MPVAYLPKDAYNHAIQTLAPGTTQVVAIGATSAATANALANDTIVIRVVATANCFINIGTGTPTATTSNLYLPVGAIEYFRVDGNYTIKVAVIQSSGTGNLYVTEMY